MFCSGCGSTIEGGQSFCPQCGRTIVAPIPTMPGLDFQVENYAGKIRALSVVWFVYAALALTTGIIGMAFARAFMNGHFGPWMNNPWWHGPMPPHMFGPAILEFAWVILLCRVALALVAGWGLMEHAPWGRMVAIVAAVLSILKVPFGTAIGIWTLVVLLGYRNSSLYDQL
jgi:hypothetical protein